MRAILLIPFKSLATAKQRLAAALDQRQRSHLAEAMLLDVMTAATGVADRIDVALVTGDARAQALAREFGFQVIEDARNESETAAIEMATAWGEERGYDTTIVVPADIPLIASAELDRVLDAAPQEGAVFVVFLDTVLPNIANDEQWNMLKTRLIILPLYNNESLKQSFEQNRAIFTLPSSECERSLYTKREARIHLLWQNYVLALPPSLQERALDLLTSFDNTKNEITLWLQSLKPPTKILISKPPITTPASKAS